MFSDIDSSSYESPLMRFLLSLSLSRFSLVLLQPTRSPQLLLDPPIYPFLPILLGFSLRPDSLARPLVLHTNHSFDSDIIMPADKDL